MVVDHEMRPPDNARNALRTRIIDRGSAKATANGGFTGVIMSPGTAWREWDPYHGDRFWTEEVTTEEFEATAEIREWAKACTPATANAPRWMRA